MSRAERLRLAAAVRDACIEAALAGYEHAAISGLCHEGAWEAAICAMRMLEPADLAAAAVPESPPCGTGPAKT